MKHASDVHIIIIVIVIITIVVIAVVIIVINLVLIILRNFEEVSKYNLSQFGGTFSVDLYMLCCYCSVKQFYTLTRIFIVNRQTIKPF